mmetsp:Transcript_15620/g.35076  ORF Transcript_15620/g.35076 Transcript_15620/m.35076 type:complete len:1122 (+) Transcript_15620:106-3471(+)
MAGVDVAKFSELLRSLLSADNNVRQQAEKFYQQAKASEADSLYVGFLSVFANQQAEEQVRRQACVLLRQLTSTAMGEKEFVWARVQPQTRQQVAQEILRLFEAEPNPKLQKKLGDVIVKLADCTYDTESPSGWLAPGQSGWPALPLLIFRLADASQNANAGSCESALYLLKGLVGVLKQEMMSAQQLLGVVLQAGLAHADMKIRAAALQLVCEMVTVLEKKAWAALIPTGPLLIQIMQQMAQANEQELLESCLQAFLEVAQIEPDFFKGTLQQSMEPANFLSGLCKTKTAGEAIRNLALEWLVTYVEQKPKWLTKSLENMPPLVLECCMHMMLEVEDGQQELKEWITRMDDEEGEEDQDPFFHEGEEAIDRVAEALGMETIGKWLFQLIGHFSSQNQWQAKLAALSAIKQTVEYVEDESHTNEMAKLLLSHVDHQHPRVRYTALHALGQLANDQAPHFQEAWHQTVMPILLKKMDDEIDRVAAMAMSAFVSFGEELDNALMLAYSAQTMEKLVGRLKSTKHRMVQEESITSIAVVAAVMESDFSQYYDGMMPLLKQLVLHATNDKEGRLRGKAFECMSLLGLAVGKDKFLPDAKEAIFEMMKTQTKLAPDDIQREYITEAAERICKCLKDDFAIFLPHMLPMLFSSLRLEAEDANSTAVKAGKDKDEDEYINVMTGDGKTVKVRTSKFEEILQSLQLMSTFCEEMEAGYFDWVPQTAEAILPLLSTTDEVSLLCDEVRSTAFSLWALLIKCAKSASEKRGMAQGTALSAELFKTILGKTAKAMAEDDDPETLKDSADGIAECMKNAPQGVMQAQDVLQFVQQVFKLIDDSLMRTIQAEKRKKEQANDTPAGLQQDEDDEDKAQDDEESCRRSLEEILGSLMQTAPMEFLQCLNECGQRMGQWLSQPKNRTLGMWLACDMLNHLKDKSEPVWPVFMPTIFQAFGDPDYDLRIAAFYAINLAAPIPRFSEAAAQAFKLLGQYIGGKPPKKRDDKAKMAMDNAVAALLALAKDKPQACPAEVPAWQLVLSKLPLRDDEDEAKKVHKTLTELVIAQNMGLLGQDGSNTGKVLSILAEVHHQENICEKETDQMIKQVFTIVPRDQLMKFAGSFTEKQQRKIEKMIT